MIEFETLPASSREKTEYLDFATMILGGPGGYSRSNIPDYFSSRDENTDEHDIGPAVAQWKYPASDSPSLYIQSHAGQL